MIKELKYASYTFVIFLTFFLIFKYYFSDDNKRKSYKAFKSIEKIIIKHSENVIVLTDDTNQIVEYVERNVDKDRKNYNFWKLITNND
tara:strand:- start:943 stop:1206 length:264 start_codon:yes stop_codon:yes gene_type:complete